MKQFSTLIFLFFFVLNAGATKLHINPNGSDQSGKGTKSKPWQSINHALKKAKPGDTIVMSAGKFEENEILYFNNVSLVGAGSDKTFLKVNHFYKITDGPSSKSPTGHGISYDPTPEQSVIQIDGEDMEFKGFTFDGQKHKCHVAIRGIMLENVVFDDLNIFEFGYSGIWFFSTTNVTVKNCRLFNNSWGNKTRAFGNIMYIHGDGLYIHDNVIIQTINGSYGISAQDQRWRGFYQNVGGTPRKIGDVPVAAVMKNLKIFRNFIHVPEVGSWNSGQSPCISIQANMTDIIGMEIYENYVNNNMSITPRNKRDKWYGPTCHIHHNVIDMSDLGYKYAIESNPQGMEVNHNFIVGGFATWAHWSVKKGPYYKDQKYHHNIIYNIKPGNCWLKYKSYPKGLKVYENILFEKSEEGINEYFRRYAGFRKGEEGWDGLMDTEGTEISNNLFFSMNSTAEKEKWLHGTGLKHTVARDNLFYQTEKFGKNPMSANKEMMLEKIEGLEALKDLDKVYIRLSESDMKLLPEGGLPVSVSEAYKEMVEIIEESF